MNNFSSKNLKHLWKHVLLTYYTFFINNSISYVCLRLLREDVNLRLKVAKTLLTRSWSNILKNILNEHMIRQKNNKALLIKL